MTVLHEQLIRQSDLIPSEVLGTPITIIGAGAIGGWTAIALSKMGFGNLSVWDDDVVSIENLSCQPYGKSQLGQKKVEALNEVCLSQGALGMLDMKSERYRGGTQLKGIVISAVDSMEARKAIWDAHKGSAFTRYLIDPRMGAEVVLLYVVNPTTEKDQKDYETTLYSDDDSVREPCTRKSTAYCALALSGLVAAQVKSIVTNQPYSRLTQWNIPTGSFAAYEGKPS